MFSLPVNLLIVTQSRVFQTKILYLRHKSSIFPHQSSKRTPSTVRQPKTPATWSKSRDRQNPSLLTSKNVFRPTKRKSAMRWLFRINSTCVILSKFLSLLATSSRTCANKRWDNSCNQTTFQKCSYLPKLKTPPEHSWLSGSSMSTESLDWCPKPYISLFISSTGFSVYNR